MMGGYKLFFIYWVSLGGGKQKQETVRDAIGTLFGGEEKFYQSSDVYLLYFWNHSLISYINSELSDLWLPSVKPQLCTATSLTVNVIFHFSSAITDVHMPNANRGLTADSCAG